jgi:chromosome segregation ATPase
MSEELGCKAYPPITKSISQRIYEMAEDLEKEQIENEKLHNNVDALIAQRDQARNSELNALEAYQRKIGPLEKEVNALRKQLNACELALDDMRLGRAIADNKLDQAREELNGILEITEDRFYFDAIDRINKILDKLEV